MAENWLNLLHNRAYEILHGRLVFYTAAGKPAGYLVFAQDATGAIVKKFGGYYPGFSGYLVSGGSFYYYEGSTKKGIKLGPAPSYALPVPTTTVPTTTAPPPAPATPVTPPPPAAAYVPLVNPTAADGAEMPVMAFAAGVVAVLLLTRGK